MPCYPCNKYGSQQNIINHQIRFASSNNKLARLANIDNRMFVCAFRREGLVSCELLLRIRV